MAAARRSLLRVLLPVDGAVLRDRPGEGPGRCGHGARAARRLRDVLAVPAQRWRRCAGLLVAGAIGVLLAMAQVVPTLAHLSESPRAVGADYAFSSTYAWPSVRYLVTLVAPEVRGTEATWFGPYNHLELAG